MVQNKFKNFSLVLLFTILLSIALGIMYFYIKEIPIAENGSLTITKNDMEEKGYIALKGDFIVYDGLFSPNELSSLNRPFMLMTLDQIRKYDFPKGCVTAVMNITLEDTEVNALIIDEIFTANRVYVNGELISQMGKVSEEKDKTITEKKSDLAILSNVIEKEVEVVIQIANHELISGQFEKNIFIGHFNELRSFWNIRMIIKYMTATAYFTMSFFLFGLFIKNKKYTYLLSLSMAGLLNCYIVFTAFEPIIIFKATGIWYTINSMFATVPTLFAQFFGALSVFLFYQDNWIFHHKKRFIYYHIMAFTMVIVILIIFDEVVNPLYIVTTIYAIFLLFYALFVCMKAYINGEFSAKLTFIGLSSYIISYGTLVLITLQENPFQTLKFYALYGILGKIIFYAIISYITITKFSNNFSMSELEEEKLEKLINQRTNELNASYEQLLKEDKIRKQMLQDISHDLRSPITVAKGYIELIKMGKIKEQEYDKYINIIHNKMEYVSDLIKELFLLIYLENNKKFNFEIENLSCIIRETIEAMPHNKIDFIIKCEEELLVNCSDEQMTRLFNNLIENAVEYSSPESQVIIKGYHEKDWIIVEVIDQGIGISEDVLPSIFDRFTRSDKSRNLNRKHFGLGLSICKTIVENHDGAITCTSKINKGTTFKITLPDSGILYRIQDTSYKE